MPRLALWVVSCVERMQKSLHSSKACHDKIKIPTKSGVLVTSPCWRDVRRNTLILKSAARHSTDTDKLVDTEGYRVALHLRLGVGVVLPHLPCELPETFFGGNFSGFVPDVSISVNFDQHQSLSVIFKLTMSFSPFQYHRGRKNHRPD